MDTMITSRKLHRADPNRRFRLDRFCEYKLDISILQLAKTGNCDWEELPPEVQSQILLETSSLQDVFSLIRASPRFYQVFLTVREKILSTVIRRDFDYKLFSDAIYAARACLLDPRRSGVLECGELIQLTERKANPSKVWSRTPPKEDVARNVQAWERDREKDQKELLRLGPLTADEAITLSQLQRSVKFLTADYLLRLRRPRNESGEDIQRAYYRFAMFEHLFHTVPVSRSSAVLVSAGSRLHHPDENAIAFLSALPSAELEKYREIRNDILIRLTNICYRFDQYLKDPLPDTDFEIEVRAGAGDPFNGFSRKFTKSDCFCCSYASTPLQGNIRNLVSMGLGVLSRLLQADSQVQVDPVIFYGLPCCSEFATTALRLSN
ncbi:MAG: hypothetical protein M1812_003750 [Candelaria pacifica]|nr:MAG: hypothetical protein M1812_003750 [Candelaria pacifica]